MQKEGGQPLIGGLDVDVCRNYFGSQVRYPGLVGCTAGTMSSPAPSAPGLELRGATAAGGCCFYGLPWSSLLGCVHQGACYSQGGPPNADIPDLLNGLNSSSRWPLLCDSLEERESMLVYPPCQAGKDVEVLARVRAEPCPAAKKPVEDFDAAHKGESSLPGRRQYSCMISLSSCLLFPHRGWRTEQAAESSGPPRDPGRHHRGC
jgi:hypothetical protein